MAETTASQRPPKRGTARPAAAIAATTPAPAPTSITLDLRRHTQITLMPLDVRLRATSLTAEAQAITAIESTGALETADAVAANLKNIEAEITANMKAQLEPLEQAIAAAKAAAAEVLAPLEAAREKLTRQVVEAKLDLEYEGATSCYVQTRDDIKIMELDKVPFQVTWTDKKTQQQHTETLLKADMAAINRAVKGGAHVRGTYLGQSKVFGTRGAK